MIKSGDESLEGAVPTVESPPREAPHRLLFRSVISVDSHYSKKNAKTIGYRWAGTGSSRRKAPFLRATNKAALSERVLVSHLQAGERLSSVSYPIIVPMFAMFRIKFNNFYTQKGEVNLRAGDLTNVIQGIEDSLQKAGIIRDDALITKITAQKEFGLDNEIIIELFTDENAAAKPNSKQSKKPKPRR